MKLIVTRLAPDAWEFNHNSVPFLIFDRVNYTWPALCVPLEEVYPCMTDYIQYPRYYGIGSTPDRKAWLCQLNNGYLLINKGDAYVLAAYFQQYVPDLSLCTYLSRINKLKEIISNANKRN